MAVPPELKKQWNAHRSDASRRCGWNRRAGSARSLKSRCAGGGPRSRFA